MPAGNCTAHSGDVQDSVPDLADRPCPTLRHACLFQVRAPLASADKSETYCLSLGRQMNIRGKQEGVGRRDLAIKPTQHAAANTTMRRHFLRVTSWVKDSHSLHGPRAHSHNCLAPQMRFLACTPVPQRGRPYSIDCQQNVWVRSFGWHKLSQVSAPQASALQATSRVVCCLLSVCPP